MKFASIFIISLGLIITPATSLTLGSLIAQIAALVTTPAPVTVPPVISNVLSSLASDVINDFPFPILNTAALTNDSINILSNIANVIKYVPSNLTQYLIDNSNLFDKNIVKFYCLNP